MTFEQWLAANGYDVEAINKPESAKQRKHLEAAWKAETAPAPKPPEEKPAEASAGTFDEKMAAIEAEAARVEAIRDMTAKAAATATHDPAKIKRLRDIGEAAVRDPKCTVQTFQLTMLREERSIGPMVLTPAAPQATEDILEAAFCTSLRLPDVEKRYKPETLEAAHKQYRRGIGLQELLLVAAERNGGYRGSARDLPSVIRHAKQGLDNMQAGAWGPSTISVPTILANIANKFLFVGFNAVDQTWRRCSATRSVSDYKQISTVGLTGDLQYKELPPSGEIKHGTLGETVYNNQATIFARMLGLDERDLKNDDAGALASASTRLGRGAALALNDRFWSVFLNNSSFFSSGNSNVITGASSVLSGGTGLGALNLADAQFRTLTDPDGKPMAVTPKILLVPTALRVSALTLMGSTLTIGTTTANAPLPATNPWASAFTVVSSPYMQNSTYTGYSTTAWYLLADPNEMPVIEVVFVDGVDTPQIESEAADFNMQGMQMKGILRFGVALQEFRGGVRAAGA
jgi:hypothetical protein